MGYDTEEGENMVIKEVTIDAQTVKEMYALGASDDDLLRWVMRAHPGDWELHNRYSRTEGDWTPEPKEVWELKLKEA